MILCVKKSCVGQVTSALTGSAFAVYFHQFTKFYIHVHLTWLVDDIFTNTNKQRGETTSQMRH